MTRAEQLLSNISPEPNTGCWLWLGESCAELALGYEVTRENIWRIATGRSWRAA